MLVMRTFFWAFSGEAISKIAILATSLIAVRALSPVEFGLYLGLSATTLLAAAFWDAGVSVVMTRELAAKHLGIRRAVTQAAGIRVRIVPIWVATFVIGTYILVRHTDVSSAALAAFGVASLIIATNMIGFAVLRAQFRFKTAAASLALGRWATALSSLLALGASDALFVLALALVIGEALTLVALVVAVLYRARSTDAERASLQPSSSNLTLRAALPFAANSLLSLAYNRFDVLILALLSSSQELGLYAPASRIQDALYMITTTIAAIGLPFAAREWKRGAGVKATRALILQLMAIGLALSLPAAILIFVYAREVIVFVLGGEYAGADVATRIIVWSVPLSALTTVLIAALAGIDRAMDTTRVFIIAFAVSLVAHCSLDWWLGATGAAIATLSREPAALSLRSCSRGGLV